MKVSNDDWVRAKYFATSVVFYLLLNIFFWIAFRERLNSWSFIVSGLISGYLIYKLYLIKVRKWINNVYINENTISYEVGGYKTLLTREEIQSFGDTGHARAPYEVVIYLKNGKTVDFFPTAPPLLFKESETLALLRSWLASHN